MRTVFENHVEVLQNKKQVGEWHWGRAEEIAREEHYFLFRGINSSTKLISTRIILCYDKLVVNIFLQKLSNYLSIKNKRGKNYDYKF